MSPWKKNLLVVWTSNLVTAVGMMAFIPLIPLYLTELGVVDEGARRIWSGVLVAAAPLPAAILGPVWGALGDRVGRKLMMLRAHAAIILFVGSMAFVEGPWVMLALRLAQGCFSGYIAPAMTLVSVTTPDERQGRTAAILQTAVTAGSVLGPLVGGLVGDQLGYRAVFLVCAVLSTVSLLLVTLLVTEPERASNEQEARRRGGLLASVRADLRAFVSSPAVRVMLLAVFAVRFASSLVDPILALYVDGMQGVDPERLGTYTGIVFGVYAGAMLLLTPFWGRFGDRNGHGRTFVLCAGSAAAATLVQAFVDQVWVLVALRFLTGAALAGIMPAAFAVAARASSSGRRGGAYGFTFSSVILGRALAPVFGGLLAASMGLELLFVLAAVLLMLGAWLGGRGREGAEPRTAAVGADP